MNPFKLIDILCQIEEASGMLDQAEMDLRKI